MEEKRGHEKGGHSFLKRMYVRKFSFVLAESKNDKLIS